MPSLPVEVLLGVYLGILTGIIPAIVAGVLGFVFKYFTGVTIPGLGVVVLSLAIAGANGGLLALNDPTVRQSSNSVTLTTAIIVVLMMSLYAHFKGDQMGGTFPRHISLRKLRERTLSADVIELVGGRGQVRITPAGEVGDVEGYPPLPPELRRELSESEWTLPADLPLPELESRLADTLRTEHDLAAVEVQIDERGRASLNAAPPASGVSKRLPRGKRAVSIEALVPTGLSRGDRIGVVLDDGVIDGEVVSAQSTIPARSEPITTTDGGVSETPPPVTRAPVTDGGDGRITVGVDIGDAERLLEVDRAHVVVRSRGIRREFELLSLIRQTGKRFRRSSVSAGSSLAGTTLGQARLREEFGVVVLAVGTDSGWRIAPGGETELAAGSDLILVGTRETLDRFDAEVA